MKELMRILNASILNDLPDFCREFWDDDEEFVDWFVSLRDDDKIDVVADCVRRCLELNIKDDYNMMRMMMYCAKGSGNDYEDTDPPPPKEEVQVLTIPTITMTEDPQLKQENEELKKEILVLRRRLNPADVPEKERPVKPEPVPGRPRGRPPKYPNANDHKCLLCQCGYSSHGALFNHFHSKHHIGKVRDILTKSIQFVKDNPDLKLKVNVSVCNKRNDPKLSQEDPTEEDLQNILDYADDKINPISDVLLVQGTERPSSTGRKEYSWKKVFG